MGKNVALSTWSGHERGALQKRLFHLPYSKPNLHCIFERYLNADSHLPHFLFSNLHLYISSFRGGHLSIASRTPFLLRSVDVDVGRHPSKSCIFSRVTPSIFYQRKPTLLSLASFSITHLNISLFIFKLSLLPSSSASPKLYPPTYCRL